MTLDEKESFNMMEESTECPDCGNPTPQRQIETMNKCERCYLDGDKVNQTQNSNTGNNNLVDQWKNKGGRTQQ